ncbi:glycosyltransferase family 4 protein [Bradyrhizobium guangzhouense]|nr:glycosyltransferase family 4 protein [Bradyrhizobium guangzhouense]
MTKYSVYFWEPELSPHKLPLFKELLDHPRISHATYIAEADLNTTRKREGWQVSTGRELPIILGPSAEQVETIVANSPNDAIHIFSGMRWVPCIVNGLRAVVKHRRRFGLLHEPRVLEGIGGVARLGHSWLTERPLRRNANFVLAIGSHGPRWFRLTGYPNERIFPFAYFLSEPPVPGTKLQIGGGSAPVVTFLGRLEKLKGIHLFLNAIDKVENEARFYVAGFGTWSSHVEKARETHQNLQFAGPIKMTEVPSLLASTDVLVLPSITMDDGWGAVISEALMAGAAVVASHKVGASMCLADRTRGRVVRQLSGSEVARAIDDIIDDGLLQPNFRKVRADWANKHLTQVAGADYLIKIFDCTFLGKSRPNSFVLEHD